MKHQLTLIMLLVMAMTDRLTGAEQLQKLRVLVTSSSGNSVYLDKGRADGIVEGLDVKLYPDGTTIVGVVRAVSANSARVEFELGVEIPHIGTPGEVEVPSPTRDEAAGQPAQEPPPARTAPEHPPW